MATGPTLPQSTTSLSDLLTTLKNLVQAQNNSAITSQNVSSGLTNAAGITSTTLVKSGPGIVSGVSVIIAGSTTGMIYDAAKTTDTSSPLLVIPTTVGFISAPHAVTKGIVVVPGSGQTVTVFYS